MHFIICFVFCFFKLSVESTDIAAAYHQGILLLKDANKISTTSPPLKAEELQVDLEHKLGFPIALTFDPLQRRIFVADSKARETQLFSLAIEESSPIKILPLLTELSSSVVDGLVYGPKENFLFWTDASRHGIYSGNLSDLSKGPVLLTDRNVNKPRGITFDHCNQALYWTEREDERSSIERYDLKQKTQVSLAVGVNHTYYQTIDYNIQTKEIIWAESVGSTVADSSCRFVAKSIETGEESTLASFEDCFPFALTSDEDHIYWSDWNKEGVMRFSRRDPKHSLVKLVETPKIRDSQYKGAYGIVNLLKMSPEAEGCMNQKAHGDASIISKVTESDVQAKISDLGSKFVSGIPVQVNESPLSISLHSEKEKIFVPSASTSEIDFKETSTYRQQRLVIIILAIICSLFMISTLILLWRLCLAEFKIFKLIRSVCSHTPGTTETHPTPKKSKQHRRFKPNHKILEGQLCQRSADDGVKIDIEDCCQMTLCDTPCFTSVKKEGKPYKEPRSPRKANDKEKLLDDYETA